QEVAFSLTTFPTQFKWIVRADSGIKKLEDLKGKRVALTQGSNTNAFVQKLSAERGLDLQIVSGKDHAESFLFVETGRAAAFMEDDVLVYGLKANARDPKVFDVPDIVFPSDPYALMFRKDDPAFKALVDGVLRAMMQNGEFAALYKTWFESPV